MSLSKFLDRDISQFDLVCLKSHYDDSRVWDKIELQDGLCAVNDHDSTMKVADRARLDVLLRDSGVPIPISAHNKKELAQIHAPIIAKPRYAWDHDLQIHQEVPVTVDFDRIFIQELLANDGLDYKVYCTGEYSSLIVRPASFHKEQSEKINESRSESEVIPELGSIAKLVGKVTGLEIYGVDFVKSEGNYYVIDVNPFPGFIGIDQAPKLWWEYLEESS